MLETFYSLASLPLQAFCIYILFGNQVPTYEGNQSFNIYEAAMSTGLLMEKKKNLHRSFVVRNFASK